MLNIAVVLAVLAVALLVGRSQPLLGGLLATFPTKIFGYVAGSGDNVAEGLRGLVFGSIASLCCAVVILFAIQYGIWIAICSGLLVWCVVALMARFVS